MNKLLVMTMAAVVATAMGALPKYTFNGIEHEDFVGMSQPDPSVGVPMKLHLMTDEVANGVVCLDGSPAGFYFSPATDPKNADKWEIYFQGGGWCYDEVDCWGRSKGNLGSSTKWGNTSSIGGVMSDDCNVNPDFCTWNRVHMGYCDGNSFSGNRDEPIVVNGDKVYFRGHRIVDATFRALSKLGLNQATEVLLTGCSAGGLATFLHTDYVGGLVKSIPNLKRFKAIPISGFFLLHNTVENKPVYPDEMQYIFHLSNATNGVNDACIKSQPSGNEWRCNFAQETYKHIQNPIFPLNSALDSWQTGCIYTSEYVPKNSTQNGDCGAAPGWHDCSSDPEKCTSDQMERMVQYQIDFMNDMNQTSTYTKAGNGGFIYSCHTHCAGQSSSYNKFTVNGMTMQQAVSKWWNSDDSTPASENTYKPCLYNTKSTPHKCNPTC